MDGTYTLQAQEKVHFKSIDMMYNKEKNDTGFTKIMGTFLLVAVFASFIYFYLSTDFKPSFWIIASIIFLLTLFIFFVAQIIVGPVIRVKQTLNLLNKGILPDKIKPAFINIYKKIITNVNEAIDLRHGIILETKKINAGNFNNAGNLKVSYGQLGEELNGIFRGIEIHAFEEEKRNWTNIGLAKFGDYLRTSSDIKEVSRIVLSNLVKYINAEQGLFYVVNEELSQQILKLESGFAVENKNGTIEYGEGLVGQCWKDGDHKLINNIPEKYCTIMSGMGHTVAKSIIIIPLKHDSIVQGVLEIASFNAFPEHCLEFLFKLSDSIASTLFNLRVNEQTKLFLSESQKQAERLIENEEIMQQQIEEMRATQEEIERVKEKMNAQLLVFNQIVAISKTDLNGNITFVNDFMLERTGYQRHELIGKNHNVLQSGKTSKETFVEMWKTITSGSTFRGEVVNKSKDGKFLYNDSIVAPIKNSRGQNIEYLAIRFPIDEQKKRELEMVKARNTIENEKKKHQAILEGNVDGIISFNGEGIIQYINKAGEEILAASRTTLVGIDIKELIPIEIDKSGKAPEVYFTRNDEKKKIGLRTEMCFDNKIGSTVDILASITGTELEDGHLFTLFAQNVTVDLF